MFGLNSFGLSESLSFSPTIRRIAATVNAAPLLQPKEPVAAVSPPLSPAYDLEDIPGVEISALRRMAPPTVTIDQGTYIGKVVENPNHPVPIEAFLGVRYAKPPVGELRFAKPVALPSSEETFEATEFGCRYALPPRFKAYNLDSCTAYRCPSQQFVTVEGAPNLEPNEDCLTANIFRWQNTASNAALPIMVYFHGGGETSKQD